MNATYSECNENKLLCAGYPNNCVKNKNCEILSSSKRINENGTVQFTLFATFQPTTTHYYVALSVSNTQKMGGSVVYCYLNGKGAGQIGSGYIKDYDVLSDYNDGIQLNNQVTFADSILSCQWLRSGKTVVNGTQYDFLNNKYYILLAKGSMNEGMNFELN